MDLAFPVFAALTALHFQVEFMIVTLLTSTCLDPCLHNNSHLDLKTQS